MDGDGSIRVVLGAILGVGCGAFLLISCVVGGFWMWTAALAGTPAYTPPPVVAPPPPPVVAPPPPSLPPVYPPSLPPMVPPSLPPSLPPPPLPPSGADLGPRIVRATVTEVSGSAGVTVGALCEFNVERREDASGFSCNAQVVCGGRLLYGGAGAGFFPCTLYDGPPRDVVGSDEATTAVDGDGAMSLDTRAGTLTLWDDATGMNGELRVTAHVDSVE